MKHSAHNIFSHPNKSLRVPMKHSALNIFSHPNKSLRVPMKHSALITTTTDELNSYAHIYVIENGEETFSN